MQRSPAGCTALVGEPPLAYLTRWRMELAARHVRESNELVAHIAGRVGYRSELHRQIEANEAS